jgi:hypothetical protein
MKTNQYLLIEISKLSLYIVLFGLLLVVVFVKGMVFQCKHMDYYPYASNELPYFTCEAGERKQMIPRAYYPDQTNPVNWTFLAENNLTSVYYRV